MTSLFIIILVGILDAMIDTLSFHFSKSIFYRWKDNKWVNPALSWKNKWKDESATKEKFFGSSTIFVFVTDLWHLLKFIMIVLICFSIVFYTPIINWEIDALIVYCTYTIIKELFFKKILSKI